MFKKILIPAALLLIALAFAGIQARQRWVFEQPASRPSDYLVRINVGTAATLENQMPAVMLPYGELKVPATPAGTWVMYMPLETNEYWHNYGAVVIFRQPDGRARFGYLIGQPDDTLVVNDASYTVHGFKMDFVYPMPEGYKTAPAMQEFRLGANEYLIVSVPNADQDAQFWKIAQDDLMGMYFLNKGFSVN